MAHPGAVAVLAVDGDALILVRQPREAVGDPDLLELPAGKLDEGEDHSRRQSGSSPRRSARAPRAGTT